jgi:uncharacterized damage-inducible protein DinB
MISTGIVSLNYKPLFMRKNIVLSLCLALISSATFAQQIKAPRGFSPQVGAVFSMMEDLKSRVTRSVQDLSLEETDFLLDEKANRIGALILHLAATEAYYQSYTFEGRGYNAEEKEKWEIALNLGDEARDKFIGKPISYYLEIWDEVRAESKRLLKAQDDDWLQETAAGSTMNMHWAWYHVMEHQANHMGQIRLIIGRIPG